MPHIPTVPRPDRRRLGCRLLALAVAAGALMFAAALPAAAHVTVNPNEVAGGSWAKLTFRVPTESATASTIQLTVTFPTDHPLASVNLKPKPGWTATTATAELPAPVKVHGATLTKAVHTVTWKADGEGILPGQFDEFDISVGPLPDTGTLVFDAAQAYSDGSVVNWDETTPDADHPAPTLTLADPPAGDSSDEIARGLAIAALVVALAAVALAALRPRRSDARGSGS